MHVFSLEQEQEWNSAKNVEKILGRISDGDVSIACWEPGQTSSYHCHPDATEIYFCWSGGGTMRTPKETVAVTPGSFVVHPPGEVHEYINGPDRSMLFRVRYGADMAVRQFSWNSRPDWKQKDSDTEYYRLHPVG